MNFYEGNVILIIIQFIIYPYFMSNDLKYKIFFKLSCIGFLHIVSIFSLIGDMYIIHNRIMQQLNC